MKIYTKSTPEEYYDMKEWCEENVHFIVDLIMRNVDKSRHCFVDTRCWKFYHSSDAVLFKLKFGDHITAEMIDEFDF